MMTRKILSAALLASCLLVAGCGSQAGHKHETVYSATTVQTQNQEMNESYPAAIEGRQDIAILPQVSGTIVQVCVREGQRVSRGQTLFVIDQVPFKAALQMAEANVEAAEAGVATAQLVYDSRLKLYDQKVVSEFDLMTAKNNLLTAKAGLAQAKAQLVTASNNYSYTTVKSPSAGVVGTLPYRVGALVSPQLPQPLTTVSDNSEMYVYFSLGENQLLALTAEHGSMDEVLASIPDVKLRLNDGQIYAHSGRVESISGVIDRSTGSVSVRAVFPNEGGLLHSGASGAVIIPSVEEDCIVISRGITYEVQDKVYCYVVRDGKAVSTMLDVTPVEGGREYIVRRGLSTGDVVITEGVGMLHDGADVNIKLNEEE